MKFENQYSGLDRAIHRLAFSMINAQVGLADLEDRLFATSLKKISVNKPVFITSLPRAGTTLLLELCVETGLFASHCYRDMPFVLIPLFWERFSKKFRKPGVARERAHGDGMLVNEDSAEAFEEIAWKSNWPGKYKNDSIIPWGKNFDKDFAKFLTSHMRKVIYLRKTDATPGPRYISKNNLNIARFGFLRKTFPDAIFIVPVREPVSHAQSLLRQHKNFMGIHGEDVFSKKYMADIGHYDFGENLKPVNFAQWFDNTAHSSPLTMEFWLDYWLAAFSEMVKQSAEHGIQFVSYQKLCDNPEQGLAKLSGLLEMDDVTSLANLSGRITASKATADPAELVADKDLLARVHSLYGELLQRSAI